MDYIRVLSGELKLAATHIEQTIRLIDEGNTIPFIARYRKEVTGSMDDQTLRLLAERLAYLRALDARRSEVHALIDAQGAMTEEIAAALERAVTLAELDDIYRPYRPKRKTRASVARDKGLEPLALAIFAQNAHTPEALAAPFVDPDKGVETPGDALSGAGDIIAEMISDDAAIRSRLRALAAQRALIRSRALKEDDSVYRLYYDFTEPAASIAGHRVLALGRGEREGYLSVTVELDRDSALRAVCRDCVRPGSACAAFVRQAAEDAYDRLIFPSVERELRRTLTENANESAIRLFALNLRQLLLQPPVKGQVALGLDPGYRTGCKYAVVDATGRVLATGAVYPTAPANRVREAAAILGGLIRRHGVTVIAIGNGTASRETEQFVSDMLAGLSEKPSYMVVSEAGASVYSASKLGAEEFPQLDVSVRSAVSIARRLQDPLAELVKIDPKAIGVGQYQHDMPQKRLSEALDGVVESCVNSVGVDLNTASPALLSRVSGISAPLAHSIVAYREEHGAFASRTTLKKVPKLGPKAFLQCAGFLRLVESKNVLDRTAVHPESYDAARALLTLCGFSEADVAGGTVGALPERVAQIGERECAGRIGCGVPTLRDIVAELTRPGRDMRDELPPPLLRTAAMSLSDLREGMTLEGTVRNVIDFGAFVDIGVHEDGLVHVSQLSDRFVRHPSEAVRVGDVVRVRVLSVDVKKKRISLTMKSIDP